jgi:hypothetical protein
LILSAGEEFFVMTVFDGLSSGAAIAAAPFEDTTTDGPISCTNDLYKKRPGMANFFY